MDIAVVSLFPELLAAASSWGMTGRAIERGQLALHLRNPRDYATDRHGSVDDRPYGGGPGMLLKADILAAAIADARTAVGADGAVIYLSPQGQRFAHARAVELAQRESLILLAGRYEGVDERLLQTEVDEELSIGDYVLSGGEVAAMVVIDALSRLLPGVLGDALSAQQDSFADGLLDCPHYTRPECYRGRVVPPVLLSGNHAAIRRWRLKQSLGRTLERRPDLLAGRELSSEEEELLAEYRREQLQAAPAGQQ